MPCNLKHNIMMPSWVDVLPWVAFYIALSGVKFLALGALPLDLSPIDPWSRSFTTFALLSGWSNLVFLVVGMVFLMDNLMSWLTRCSLVPLHLPFPTSCDFWIMSLWCILSHFLSRLLLPFLYGVLLERGCCIRSLWWQNFCKSSYSMSTSHSRI